MYRSNSLSNLSQHQPKLQFMKKRRSHLLSKLAQRRSSKHSLKNNTPKMKVLMVKRIRKSIRTKKMSRRKVIKKRDPEETSTRVSIEITSDKEKVKKVETPREEAEAEVAEVATEAAVEAEAVTTKEKN